MNKDQTISVDFIKQIKQQILSSRYVVAKIANAESLKLYYSIGKSVEEQAQIENWGAKVLEMVSARLQQELPGLRGFSASNLKKMRQFYKRWNTSIVIGSLPTNRLENKTEIIENEVNRIGSLLTNQMKDEENINAFYSISFTHHFEIISAIKNEEYCWYYIKNTAGNFWTVAHLRNELKNKSHLQNHKLPNNFEKSMPNNLSKRAINTFKDQYLLDFVNVEDADDDIDERILEQKIILNIKKFLMALGNDFTFMGNQYRLKVSDDEYFVDLLFFHRGLQSLVAFELKKGKFKPEYIGKMNFYLSALDDLVKQPHENPSIGIILCKEKDDRKVEYSFRDFSKPMGVSTYKTSEKLPPELQKALPDAKTLKKLLD
ncbi:PDDEXK nuclease domain-containing protein [Frigoriflavimonas asaccharolytica]|uniref:Putative nuclease of restriction endonuclease-like (RecB) superfamily n=1 Tax=Frigoriflavimonas asaccharolytica TaxID=2735899 RepID=A0A8J8GAJ2_9FLAO|nr:PDDEXK nuclease domain-containing protein [Frigoriflavimonas asaccharolytica]NRS92077.1 putative nuclease of restriction endonuclease-like (RecB) superfamily [Frigoriflavimonas asaccharolytica]